MAGLPQIGGGNGVAELDFGQPGSALNVAGTVKSTCKVIVGDLTINEDQVQLPEADGTFNEIVAFTGQRVVIEALMQALTDADLNSVEREIETYRYGRTHNADGTRTRSEATLTKAKPTTLIDSFGRTLTTRARIIAYQRIGRRRKTQDYGAVQQARIVLEVMD